MQQTVEDAARSKRVDPRAAASRRPGTPQAPPQPSGVPPQAPPPSRVERLADVALDVFEAQKSDVKRYAIVAYDLDDLLDGFDVADDLPPDLVGWITLLRESFGAGAGLLAGALFASPETAP
jgi:hypothetical protein